MTIVHLRASFAALFFAASMLLLFCIVFPGIASMTIGDATAASARAVSIICERLAYWAAAIADAIEGRT